MGILNKKVSASSLTEVLIATVLIVVVIGIAITTLNNVLQNSVTKSTQAIETELSELQYLYKNKKITLPFYDEIDNWNVSITKDSELNVILFEAAHQTTKKSILKKLALNDLE